MIDGTPECRKARRFAALRARRTGGQVTLLYPLEPPQFQQWGGVQDILAAEAEDAARAALAIEAAAVKELLGTSPHTRIRQGTPTQAVQAELAADPSIRALVLAADSGGNPGPLVNFFSSGKAGDLQCVVIIVPGTLADERIDQLT